MDEKFIEALGGSVDNTFAQILRESQKQPQEPKKEVKRRSPRRKFSRSRKMKGGKTTWIQHVRLTAGAQKLSWGDAMVAASKTWVKG